MTTWSASVGDILDATADGLICSANPQLNLSGGIGGAIGLRYGRDMQQFLHKWLTENGQRFVQPGGIVVSPSFGSPFKIIVHAVAIDAFYDTSPDLIRKAYESSLGAMADAGCRTVVAACLACGYGRASPHMFVSAINPLLSRSLHSIDRVEFISTDAELIGLVQGAICKPAE